MQLQCLKGETGNQSNRLRRIAFAFEWLPNPVSQSRSLCDTAPYLGEPHGPSQLSRCRFEYVKTVPFIRLPFGC